MPKPDDDVLEFIPEDKARKKFIEKVADVLEREGVHPEDIGAIEKIKFYQGFYKDNDGKEHIVDMSSISISPSWAEGPKWPLVQPAKPFVVKYSAAATKPLTEDGTFKRCLILPDMQIGFYFDKLGNMHATHDERALDLALQIVALYRPHRIIMNGDNLDFPELGKYRLTPAFVRTTQASIDATTVFMAKLRAAAGPNCLIDWLEGNHEKRITNYILDNAFASFGLRRGDAPESWPVLSIPSLCRLDEFDINYVPGYPANEVWINDRLMVVHGENVVSNGSTAHKYLAKSRVSIIYGHIHRREWAERTTRGANGKPHTIMAFSAGCLARIDGSVPSTKGGVDLDGVPIPVVEDWQQGVGLIQYEEGNGRFIPEMIPFHNGWTIFRNCELTAKV